MKTFNSHFEESCKMRDQYWKSFGEVSSDVLSHIINPALMGGPMWPALRQAFILIKGKDSRIIASDGLSDPFETGEAMDRNGFELEFFVETNDKFETIEQCKGSWQFNLVYQMSQFAAGHGGIIQLLHQMKYLSTELYDVNAPSEYINEQGRVGVMLGLPHDYMPQSVKLSISEISMVNVKLLTVRELNYCVENGSAGRVKLAEDMLKQNSPTLSSLERTSFI